MNHAQLICIDSNAAHAVHDEWYPEGGHGNSVSRDPMNPDAVNIYYVDPRFPLDVAEWAFENGHAQDEDASRVIAAL